MAWSFSQKPNPSDHKSSTEISVPFCHSKRRLFVTFLISSLPFAEEREKFPRGQDDGDPAVLKLCCRRARGVAPKAGGCKTKP